MSVNRSNELILDPLAHRIRELEAAKVLESVPLLELVREFGDDVTSIQRYDETASRILHEVRARVVTAMERAAEEGRWISVQAAAEMLDGTPEPTIRDWCRKGKVRAVKTGGEWRIERNSLFREAA